MNNFEEKLEQLILKNSFSNALQPGPRVTTRIIKNEDLPRLVKEIKQLILDKVIGEEDNRHEDVELTKGARQLLDSMIDHRESLREEQRKIVGGEKDE